MIGIRTSLAFVAFSLAPAAAGAQQLDLDGSWGYTSEAWRAAVSSQWHLRAGHLSLGAGLRLTRYAGREATYRNQGEVSAALPATLPIDPDVWGLNLMVSGAVPLVGPVGAGANIDLLGFAAGSSRRSGTAVVEPARGSLLLYGDNDRGSLNSEFFVMVRLGSAVGLRGGMSHYVVGYHVSSGGITTRYLRFDTVPFIAIRWAGRWPLGWRRPSR